MSHVEQLENTLRSEKTTFNLPSRSKLRGKRRLEVITDAVQDLKNLNQSMNPSTIAREDECDIMGKHIAFQLRELTEYDRVLAHYDIQKILMNYRLKNMNRQSSSSSSITTFSRPNSTASTIESIPYTPETYSSEDSTTTDIIHSAMVYSDIGSEFYRSGV